MKLIMSCLALCFLTGCASVPSDTQPVAETVSIDHSELIYGTVIQDAYALSEVHNPVTPDIEETP